MKSLAELRNKKLEKLLESGDFESFKTIDTILMAVLFLSVCPVAAFLVYILTLDRELVQSEIKIMLILSLACILIDIGVSLKLFYDRSLEKGVTEARLLEMLQQKTEENFHMEAASNIRYNETIDDIQKKVHMLSKVNNSEDIDRQQKLDSLIDDLEETYVENAKKIPEYTDNKFIDSIIYKVTNDHPDIALTWRGKVPGDLKFTEYELSTIFYIPLNLAFDNAAQDGCSAMVSEIRFSGTTMYLLIMQKDSFSTDKWNLMEEEIPSNISYDHQYELKILYSLLKKKESFFSVYSKDGAGYCEIIIPSACLSVQAPFVD